MNRAYKRRQEELWLVQNDDLAQRYVPENKFRVWNNVILHICLPYNWRKIDI